MSSIKLTKAQISFLFNNLDVELKGIWAEQLVIQCGDFFEHSEDIIFCLYLDADDALQAIITMNDNVKKIFSKLKKSICSGSFDTVSIDTVNLEMTAGIIRAINYSLNK